MSAKTDGVYKNIDISFKIRQVHINKTSRFPVEFRYSPPPPAKLLLQIYSKNPLLRRKEDLYI